MTNCPKCGGATAWIVWDRHCSANARDRSGTGQKHPPVLLQCACGHHHRVHAHIDYRTPQERQVQHAAPETAESTMLPPLAVIHHKEEYSAPAHKSDVSTCRGCNAPIVFERTKNGEWMPKDLDGTPHFATCPKAHKFRRRDGAHNRQYLPIYTTGYHGHDAAELLRYTGEKGMVVADVRYSANSWAEQWRKESLQELLGAAYIHVPQLGNPNYNNLKAPTIQDAKAGIAFVLELAKKHPIILLCQCVKFEECHRRLIAELLDKRGVETLELDIKSGDVFRYEPGAAKPPSTPSHEGTLRVEAPAAPTLF